MRALLFCDTIGLEGFLALVQQERGCSNSVAGPGLATVLSVIVLYEIEHIVHNDLFKQDNAKSLNLNFPHLQNPARKVLESVVSKAPLKDQEGSGGPADPLTSLATGHRLAGGGSQVSRLDQELARRRLGQAAGAAGLRSCPSRGSCVHTIVSTRVLDMLSQA